MRNRQRGVHMYIIQNAFQNILRNRGRNILVAVIIFAVITTSVVALIINNTASGIIDDYKARFGSEVTISPNRQMMQARPAGGGGGAYTTGGRAFIEPISPQQYLAFADSEFLLYTDMSASAMAGCDEHCSDLTAYGAENDAMGGLRMAGMDDESYIMPRFRLIGGEWEDFDSGLRAVDEGRMIEADNECLISWEFAGANRLSVGDSITIGGSSMPDLEGEVQNTYYILTVVGVYDDLTEEDVPGMFASSLMNRRNEILVSFDTLAAPAREGPTGASVSAAYTLKDPSMLASFEAEVRAKGLSGDYAVSTDEDGYNTIVKPVVGMKGVTFTFLIVVLVLGAIILLLLTSIAVRERKYEIGVLRAMGMKKGKVALGLWSELLMITCVCVILGLLAGVIAAQPVSDALLTGQLESINNAANSNRGGPQMVAMRIGAPIGQQYSALDTLDVSLGADTLLQIIAIALILATVAALAAISRITQYEPIKILMERN